MIAQHCNMDSNGVRTALLNSEQRHHHINIMNDEPHEGAYEVMMPNKESQNTRTKKRIYGNEQRCDIEKLTQPTQAPTLVRGHYIKHTTFV